MYCIFSPAGKRELFLYVQSDTVLLATSFKFIPFLCRLQDPFFYLYKRITYIYSFFLLFIGQFPTSLVYHSGRYSYFAYVLGSSMVRYVTGIPDCKVISIRGGSVSTGLHLLKTSAAATAIIEAAVSILLLFGGNDIQRPGANADKLKHDFKELIELIKQINPNVAISVCEILPRGTMTAAEEKIRLDFNKDLRRLLLVRWGVSKVLLQRHYGGTSPDLDSSLYAQDRIHLNPAGNKRLRTIFKTKFGASGPPTNQVLLPNWVMRRVDVPRPTWGQCTCSYC